MPVYFFIFYHFAQLCPLLSSPPYETSECSYKSSLEKATWYFPPKKADISFSFIGTIGHNCQRLKFTTTLEYNYLLTQEVYQGEYECKPICLLYTIIVDGCDTIRNNNVSSRHDSIYYS